MQTYKKDRKMFYTMEKKNQYLYLVNIEYFSAKHQQFSSPATNRYFFVTVKFGLGHIYA